MTLWELGIRHGSALGNRDKALPSWAGAVTPSCNAIPTGTTLGCVGDHLTSGEAVQGTDLIASPPTDALGQLLHDMAKVLHELYCRKVSVHPEELKY